MKVHVSVSVCVCVCVCVCVSAMKSYNFRLLALSFLFKFSSQKMSGSDLPKKFVSCKNGNKLMAPIFFLSRLFIVQRSFSEQRHFLEIYGNVSLYRLSYENECTSFFSFFVDKLSQLEVAIFSHCKLL